MPRSVAAVYRFELAKAARAKAAWVTLAVPVAAALATVWWDSLSRRLQSLAGDEIEFKPSAFLGFSKGAGNGFIIGGILLLLYSSMIFANEGHWKTFKTIMLRPHSRLAWTLGKFLALLTLAFALAAAVAASSFVAASLFGDFTAIVEPGGSYVYFEMDYMVRQSLLAVALVLPPLAALCAFGLMFSTFTDHTGVAASAALGAYIVLETAKGSMPEGKKYLFNTFVPSLVDTSYFQALRGFADGMSDTGWEPERVYYNVGAPLAAAALFLAVACIVFKRRNILV